MREICVTFSNSNENLHVWFMQIMDTLHSFKIYNGTQEEHKSIAENCKSIFKQSFPIVSRSLNW